LIADFLTARSVLEAGAPPDPNALPIQITGHQWWWEIRYPGKEPVDLVTTANEIHLPVGRTVRVDLNSVDVIHSFWIPNLSGKKDMIPGHPTSTWLRAVREGVFRGQCAEFCGLQHAYMDLHVVTESPVKFAAWLKEQQKSAPAPTEPSTQLGRQVFEQRTCLMCHRIQGSMASATVGPDLTHFAGRAMLAGAVPNTRENLARWIVDPSSTKPGVLMPPTPLKPAELNALLDYLATLR
jgi:cytochrome c oxidase subunit 2